MFLVIDNYDSFTHNLIHYIQRWGVKTTAIKNDEYCLDKIQSLKPTAILISPGPGRPENSGVCLDVLQLYQGKIPIFGVCLGLQLMAIGFGGRVGNAYRVMHGKTSKIYHDGEGLFRGIPQGFQATRYHSLIVQDVPKDFKISAWTENLDNGQIEIMGLRHKSLILEGVQFHPEAILTDYGHEIIGNMLMN